MTHQEHLEEQDSFQSSDDESLGVVSRTTDQLSISTYAFSDVSLIRKEKYELKIEQVKSNYEAKLKDKKNEIKKLNKANKKLE